VRPGLLSELDPDLVWRKAARQIQRSGASTASPRPSACANASAIASLAKFLVAAEGHERAPQSGAVVPPHAFDGIAGTGHGDIVNPHTPQGTMEPKSCRESMAHNHGFRSVTRMIGVDICCGSSSFREHRR
jgi:hypothetical protein